MTLAFLRSEFLDESHIERLTSSAPPIVRTVQESGGRYTILEEQEPADANGRNLSAGLVALLGQITAPHSPDNCEDCRRNPLLNEQRTSYSPRFPVRRALLDLERMCRRRHRDIPGRTTWSDHNAGPICAVMVRSIIEGGASVYWAAQSAGVPYPRAERLVGAGAHFVWLRLVHWDHERAGVALEPDCAMCSTRRAPFHVDRERVAG